MAAGEYVANRSTSRSENTNDENAGRRRGAAPRNEKDELAGWAPGDWDGAGGRTSQLFVLVAEAHGERLEALPRGSRCTREPIQKKRLAGTSRGRELAPYPLNWSKGSENGWK